MGVHRVRQLYGGFHLEPHKGNTTMRGSWPEWQWPDPDPLSWPDERWPAGHIPALLSVV